MNQKRVVVFIFLALLMFSFVASVVSAQEADPVKVTENVNKGLALVLAVFRPIVVFLIGDTATGGELTIKILAFFLALTIIWGTLSTFKFINTSSSTTNTSLNFAIGLIIATIGVRFMPDGLLTSMTAPSSAFVAVLFLGVPFLAFFFISKDRPAYLQQLMWFMFAFLIGVVAIYNAFWGNPGVQKAYDEFGWIYVAFALSAFSFGIYGGHIQKFIQQGADLNALDKFDRRRADEIMATIQGLKSRQQTADNITPGAGGLTLYQRIENQIINEEQRYKTFVNAKKVTGVGSWWLVLLILGIPALFVVAYYAWKFVIGLK